MTTLQDAFMLVDWCYAVKCDDCGKTTWKVSPLFCVLDDALVECDWCKNPRTHCIYRDVESTLTP
ncbi:hypothetical protein V8B97DRAFT_1985271 [Scleroderma yunnanense]